MIALEDLGKNRFASGSTLGDLKIWNLLNGELINTYFEHTSTLTKLLFEKNFLISSGREFSDYVIKVRNLLDATQQYSFDKTNSGHADEITSLASLDNNLFASASIDTTVKVWDLSEGNLKYSFYSRFGGHSGSVLALSFLNDKNLLASGSSDKTIKIWDLTTGKIVNTLSKAIGGHTASVKFLTYLGNNLLASGSDNSIKIWKIWRLQLKTSS